ncbi:LysR family transcriptional regulator [Novosphingobium sp.]|uniref:LysR family transcriptional regulator n=1 Tax=Novosphingobium sp. TaxID=1874826 RepID=UPI003B519141
MLYLSLRQMEYVAAVARAGSLSGAALQLNVSQPSLSVALTRVEAHLGQKLFFRRKGAPITLTTAGQAYVTKVEDLLARARHLEDPAQMGQTLSGRLNLGMFDGLAPFHLGHLLRSLAAALPGIDIHYRVNDFATLAREMREGRIDCAVTCDLGLDASFAKTHLIDTRPCALLPGGHRLAHQAGVTLRDLVDEPLILSDEGLSVRHMLALFGRLGRKPVVAHRVGSLELMRSLVGNRLGVGIGYCVPPTALSYDGLAVVAIPITDGGAVEPVIVASNGPPAPGGLIAQVRTAIATAFAARAQ